MVLNCDKKEKVATIILKVYLPILNIYGNTFWLSIICLPTWRHLNKLGNIAMIR